MRNFFRKVGRVARRAYRSKAGKAIRKVTRQRYGTWRSPNVGAIAKDVSMLKGMINAEKKRITQSSSAQTQIGQYAWNGTVNSNAYFVLDVTPSPSQGTTLSTRNGASIKLSSSYLQFQFYQQSATQHPMKFRIYLIQVKGGIQTPATVASQFLQPNKFIALEQSGTAIYDYNSERHPDYFNQYRVIRKKDVFLMPDATSSMVAIKNVKLPVRYGRGKGHHIRFQGDTGNLANGQLVCLIVADSGNAGGTAGGITTAAPVSAANTGAILQYDFVHYYYDN